uniref:CCHC-type domain-containing protein n=1 Tax=Lepisosteus oculatus TaxID=7918 RepID=W5M937_LEPOC
PPDRFDGNPTKCRGFLAQCAQVFRLHPVAFFSPQDRGAPEVQDYDLFLEKFKGFFCHFAAGQDSAYRLSSIRQGCRSAQDYAIDFQVAAAETPWDNEVLIFFFLQGLCEEIKDHLVTMPQSGRTLEEVISQVLELEFRFLQRNRERSQTQIQEVPRPPPTNTLDSEQPMEIAHARLTLEERERRRREGCCMYCGKLGHFKADCPALCSSL